MIKCECGIEIDENEPVLIWGTADVSGVTTLERFRKEGIYWEAHDSYDEEIVCPRCGRGIPIEKYTGEEE